MGGARAGELSHERRFAARRGAGRPRRAVRDAVGRPRTAGAADPAAASEPASSRTSAVSPRDAAPGAPRQGRAATPSGRPRSASGRPRTWGGARAGELARAPFRRETRRRAPRGRAVSRRRRTPAKSRGRRPRDGAALPRRRALARAPFRRETRRQAPRGRAVSRRRRTPAKSRGRRPRDVGRRLPRRRALARAPFRRGRRRRDFGNESAVGSIDASTARRDERLRRCHRPVCTWITRVGARHQTRSASAPRLAGRRPTPL